MQREQGALVGESHVAAEAGEPGGPHLASLSHGHLCNVLLIQFVPGILHSSLECRPTGWMTHTRSLYRCPYMRQAAGSTLWLVNEVGKLMNPLFEICAFSLLESICSGHLLFPVVVVVETS